MTPQWTRQVGREGGLGALGAAKRLVPKTCFPGKSRGTPSPILYQPHPKVLNTLHGATGYRASLGMELSLAAHLLLACLWALHPRGCEWCDFPHPLIHVLTLGPQHVTVGSSGDYEAGREGPVFVHPPLSCTSPGGYERGVRDPEWEAGAMLCRVHTWPEGKAQRHQQGQLEAQATFSHHLVEVIGGLGLIGGFLYFSSLRPLVPCPGVCGRGRWPPGMAPRARHMGTALTRLPERQVRAAGLRVLTAAQCPPRHPALLSK